ncbi:MAG: PIN domain-containing protein [Dehalococcoidia bacterium]|nr:PIN domain-containing protein [Dehalococcoidia bacterium]
MTLDACVIYPISLCDLLLRLADAGLYRPAWSERILDEVQRNLGARIGDPAAKRRLDFMREYFEDADHDGSPFLASVPDCLDGGDKHVVATALASKSDVVVTSNVSDMPSDCLAHVGLDVQTPDEFLLFQATLAPEVVLRVLREMSADLSNPPRTPEEIVEGLSIQAPDFANLATQLLDRVS